MKTLNIIGEFFGSSGYANHTRYLINELNKLIDCKLVTNVPNGFERDVNDQELEMIKREQDFDINLIITHPLYWRINCTAKRNFVYLIWEGDKIPNWMIEECLNPEIEKIIVPSSHTKDALLNTLHQMNNCIKLETYEIEPFLQKIVKIPHGVDLKTFYPIDNNQQKKDKDDGSNDTLSGDTKQLRGKTQKDEQMPAGVDNHADSPEVATRAPFKFLSNKGFVHMNDRGGVQYLIKAYLEEFKEENVELICKINPAYGIPDIENMFPELKTSKAKIRFITEHYTKKQLNELYNECDVYVSPTRAEAFNLPCIEALACGKPIITTNFGGQIGFVGLDCGWLIDYKLEKQNDLEYEGISWATIDIDKLKKQMRWCYNNQQIVKQMYVNTIYKAKQYTWENTAKQIHSLI